MKTSPLTRLSAALAILACAVVSAQNARTPSASTTVAAEEAVILPAFEVISDGDSGYKAATAVSGTRFNTSLLDLPKPVDVMTEEFMKDVGLTDVAQLLRYNSSINQNSTVGAPEEINGPQIIFRGYLAFQTYMNGYAVSGNIDPAFFERIELIKGPSSVFAGPVEPGGTLNYLTKRPKKTEAGSISYRHGTFDRNRAELHYNRPLNPKKTVLARVDAVYEDNGNYSDFAGSEKFSTHAALRWNLAEKTDFAVTGVFTQARVVPADRIAYVDNATPNFILPHPGTFNRQGPDAYIEVTQINGSTEITHRFNDHWSLRTGTGYRYQQRERLVVDGGTATTLIGGQRATSRTARYEPKAESVQLIPQAFLLGSFDYHGITQQINAGGEFSYTWDKTDQYTSTAAQVPSILIYVPQPLSAYSFGDISKYAPNIRTHSWRRDQGYSLNNIFKVFNQRLTLQQGLRFNVSDQISKNQLTTVSASRYRIIEQEALTGSYGASYRLFRRVSVFANYGESFVPVGGTNAQGQLFEPLRGEGWDYGIKFDLISGRLSGQVVGFKVDRLNSLKPDPVSPSFNKQVGHDRSQGVEVGLLARPTDEWQINASYSNVDARTITDTTAFQVGVRLWNVPSNQGSVWNRYKFDRGPLKGFGVGVGLIAVGNRRGNQTRPDLPGLRLAAYKRWDGSLTYDRKLFGRAMSFALQGTNLNDEKYFDQFRYWSEPTAYSFQVGMGF